MGSVKFRNKNNVATSSDDFYLDIFTIIVLL